jgi:hypothetical protein
LQEQVKDEGEFQKFLKHYKRDGDTDISIFPDTIQFVLNRAKLEFPTPHTVFRNDSRNVIPEREMNAILKEDRDKWFKKWFGDK